MVARRSRAGFCFLNLGYSEDQRVTRVDGHREARLTIVRVDIVDDGRLGNLKSEYSWQMSTLLASGLRPSLARD
jgi:hypothetical protein